LISNSQKILFRKIVKANNQFVVSGHQGPDGDVIGSTLALVLGLKKLGKKVIAYNHDGCPSSLQFLPKSNLFTKDLPTKGEWILITVDSGDIKRLGDMICSYSHNTVLIKKINTHF
jgi:phosphoesterase RecJ-like protein